MIIAYHVVFTTYGTWLPNDPRGSFSKEIYNDQLRLLGEIKYGRQTPQPQRQSLMKFHSAAISHLNRAPFFIDDIQGLLLLLVSRPRFSGWALKSVPVR